MTTPLLLTQADVDRAFALIAVCADPAGSKKRLDEIMEAYTRLEKATAEHAAASQRHDERLAELQAAMGSQAAELQKKQTAHEAALAKASARHDAQCDARRRALDEREAALAAREAEAKRAAELAAQVKAHFERRAENLRAAIGG
jgi:hypothetical protein